MKILLTGFDPFGGESINPAYEAVKEVTAPDGVELIKLEVPTVFFKAFDCVKAVIEEQKPDAVICVGQAGGRSSVTPERVAINLMDAKSPDNEGFVPVDQPIVSGGENALFSTLPVKKIVSAINSVGVPSQISNTAGTFVCNSLMYGVLKLCKESFHQTIAGFIHVPYIPQQVTDKPDLPSLPLLKTVAALEAAVKCVAEERSI